MWYTVAGSVYVLIKELESREFQIYQRAQERRFDALKIKSPDTCGPECETEDAWCAPFDP